MSIHRLSVPLLTLAFAACAHVQPEAPGSSTDTPSGGSARAPASAPAPAAAGAVPGSEDPRIHEAAGAVSAERIERDVRRLEEFGTRHTLSDTVSETRGIGAARRWVHAEFERISAECDGCLEVFYVSDTIEGETRIPDPVEVVNVVAVQRGQTDPDRYFMVGGHLDSRATDVMDAEIDAPGANDSASGVAAAMEAARVLSRYELGASVAYVAFTGEEQGLFGARILAQHARVEGWRIDGLLNNDMVGNTRGITGLTGSTVARVFAPGLHPDTERDELQRILTRGGELDTPSRQLARYVKQTADVYVPTLDVEMIYRLDRFGRGGDHTPFFMEGFPAVRLMEKHEDYTRQHQDLRTEDGIEYGDVADALDYEYAARITSLDVATLASLAWAPAAPEEVSISGAVSPSTTLSWNAADDANVAGYRVYWRDATSPTWDYSRWAGDVSEITLENVVIDDYFFGVAAVSPRGHESVVVFPES